jgi:hypothetical protein
MSVNPTNDDNSLATNPRWRGIWGPTLDFLWGIRRDPSDRAREARLDIYAEIRDSAGLEFIGFADEPIKWCDWLRANDIAEYSTMQRVREERLRDRAEADLVPGLVSTEASCYSFFGGLIDILRRIRSDAGSTGRRARADVYETIRINTGLRFPGFGDEPDRWIEWTQAHDTNDFVAAWRFRDENKRKRGISTGSSTQDICD